MCQIFLFHKQKEMRYSVKRVPGCIVNSVLQQNNILQQVMQEVHSDPLLQETLSEQQENIGQIIPETYRLREELVKLKLTLKQGFVLIDETCAKHATVLDGLQSFAGLQLGTNQRVQETLYRLSGQLTIVQQRTTELQKKTPRWIGGYKP